MPFPPTLVSPSIFLSTASAIFQRKMFFFTNIISVTILGCEGCDVLFDSKLKLGSELDADDSRIHLATILTSGGPGAPIASRWLRYALNWLIVAFQFVSRYMYQLDFMLSTLLNNSPDTPISLIIITDSLKPKKVITIRNILCCYCFFSSDDLQHDWEVFIRKSDPREVWIHSNGRRGDVHEKQRVSFGEIEGLARFEGWVFGLQLHTWKAQCKHPRDEEIFWSKQQNSVATSWGPEVLVLVPVWLPFCTILDW